LVIWSPKSFKFKRIMEDKDKKILKNLVFAAIKSELENQKLEYDMTEISSVLRQRRNVFVTLKKDGRLRGCIGHLAPVQALFQDVIENARAAAFSDPRFPALTKSEFGKITIEISILSVGKKLEYKSAASLIEFLEKNKPGVILKYAGRTATFLPQVWDELSKPEQFLSHLCLKAGLAPDEWKKKVTIETYSVEKI